MRGFSDCSLRQWTWWTVACCLLLTTKGRAQEDAATTAAAYVERFPIPTARQPEAPGAKKALLVVVRHAPGSLQSVGGKTAYLLRRAMARVARGDIATVILDLDTPGGELGAAFAARDALLEMQAVTNCYVRRAISAGALLMLACDNIFVAPGSQMGTAQPLMIGPGGATSMSQDEALSDKMVTAAAKEYQATAERKGHRADIAEAFVDRGVEIPGLVDKDKILGLTGREAVANRLAIAELAQPEDILPLVGMPGATVERFSLTGREEFAYFVKSWAWLFLGLAIAGLYFEIKTPGFGVPGVLALFSLGVFFWAHYVAMTATWFEIALFAAGVTLLALEVFVIPGFGVAGIAGILCLMLSVFLSMFSLPQTEGGMKSAIVIETIGGPLLHLAIALVIFTVGAALTIRYLPQTPFWKRVALQTTLARGAGYVSVPDLERWLGREGLARTTLRPGGTVEIGGKRLDAMTQGEFIERGSRVKVVAIDGAQVVVERLAEPPALSLTIRDA